MLNETSETNSVPWRLLRLVIQIKSTLVYRLEILTEHASIYWAFTGPQIRTKYLLLKILDKSKLFRPFYVAVGSCGGSP